METERDEGDGETERESGSERERLGESPDRCQQEGEVVVMQMRRNKPQCGIPARDTHRSAKGVLTAG